jgi:hypothetical protein
MDAFEDIVGLLLEQQGYWVRGSFKVELTKAEKRLIGKFSSPRWEIDLVAYKPKTDLILAVECKSFFDSPGVRADALVGKDQDGAKRYKLFNEKRLREVVFKRMVAQLAEMGACSPSAKVQLCLAAGKIAGKQDHAKLIEHFAKKGWLLFDRDWYQSRLKEAAKAPYENSVAVVVTKMLRDPQYSV